MIDGRVAAIATADFGPDIAVGAAGGAVVLVAGIEDLAIARMQRHMVGLQGRQRAADRRPGSTVVGRSVDAAIIAAVDHALTVGIEQHQMMVDMKRTAAGVVGTYLGEGGAAIGTSIGTDAGVKDITQIEGIDRHRVVVTALLFAIELKTGRVDLFRNGGGQRCAPAAAAVAGVLQHHIAADLAADVDAIAVR